MAKMERVAAVGLAPLVAALAMLAAGFGAAAQTPGQIQDPSSYQGSMELQRQEQAQAQQQSQQNAQAQQRLDQNYAAYAPNGGGRRRAAGPPPIDWWKKPPLDPAHNPLLGRWKQTAAPAALNLGVAGLLPGANEFVAGAFAGGCDSIFGKGTTAFEPNALMWVAPDGHEEILNHVAYRTNGSDIIVLTRDPGAIPALIFALPNHDHAVVAFLGCRLARQGVRPQPVNTPRAPVPAPSAAPPGPVQSSVRAVLSFVAASAAPDAVTPLAGARIWVSRESPESAVGLPPGMALDRLAQACQVAPTCEATMKEMTQHALGSVTIDAAGHAQSPPIPAGRYYLLGFAAYQGRALAWSLPVNLGPDGSTVTLSQLNGRKIP